MSSDPSEEQDTRRPISLDYQPPREMESAPRAELRFIVGYVVAGLHGVFTFYSVVISDALAQLLSLPMRWVLQLLSPDFRYMDILCANFLFWGLVISLIIPERWLRWETPPDEQLPGSRSERDGRQR